MVESWGRYPPARHVEEARPFWRSEIVLPQHRPLLPFGKGRSYGDSCLNDGGALVHTTGLDRFISFDPQSGILRCEAGVTLAQILELGVPRGWFLNVVPGTKFVTVGGAIANDIHGKNHHRKGTFGNHVRRFGLLRSDGCKEVEPGDALFTATIGGLGLTGLVVWAELQLRTVPGPSIDVEIIPFAGLEDFFRLSDESDASHEYTVSWLDLTNAKRRGYFARGEHAPGEARGPRARAAVPLALPAVNGLTTRAFNLAYFRANQLKAGKKRSHYDPFFFPLDAVAHWNRLYGAKGFLQFQCVVPTREGIERVIDAAHGWASPLTVLKKFGGVKSPGMLSFPRPGFTLAIDLANRGGETYKLFDRLESIALDHGGALYPAKDARMSKRAFELSYPRIQEFVPHLDPAFSSGFWRRVRGE
jgi:FAD/FMN-containing dehydrogenase